MIRLAVSVSLVAVVLASCGTGAGEHREENTRGEEIAAVAIAASGEELTVGFMTYKAADASVRVRESHDKVVLEARVEAAAFQAIGSFKCRTVRLAAPLEGRTLVDGHTGERITLAAEYDDPLVTKALRTGSCLRL